MELLKAFQMTHMIFLSVKKHLNVLNVFLSYLGFPGNLASPAGYNQLPSAVASQNNEGNNNSRSHTQSE